MITLTPDASSLSEVLFARAPYPAFVVDSESLRFILANDAALRLYGYSREQFLALRLPDIYPDDQRDLPLRIIASMPDAARVEQVAREIGATRVLQHKRSDGTLVAVEPYSQRLNVGGRLAWFTVINDVSERERIRDALADASERFEAAFRNAAVGMAIFDVRGRLLQYNDAYRRITGYDDESLRATHFSRFIHPDDRERNREAVRRLLDGQAGSLVLQKRYLRPDGSVVWAQNSLSLARDASGAPRYVIYLTEDISARKEIERRLDEERERLTLALAAGRMGVWEWNLSTGERTWNDAMFELYGVDRASGTPDAREYLGWLVEEDRGRMSRELERLRETAGTAQLEVRVHRRDNGELRWILTRGAARRDPVSGQLRVIGVSYDITERKMAEQALIEADRRKDEFLAMLAHELRNPLAPIRNYVAVLDRVGGHDEVSVRARAAITRSTRHLVRLVDDLLDAARLESGKISLAAEPMRAAEIMQDALEGTRARFEERRQRLAIVLPPPDVVVNADPVRLAQVLQNLLHNASKFTPEGGSIRYEGRREDGELVVEVVDDGIGIEREQLAHVFETFWQADPPLNRADGGLGLGLALARQLVELHGGTIAVSSEGRSRGARFTVRLPLAERAARH